MTTIPVVWCTDPNSVNKKPTAFALHGIQLQGNVTEKQRIALQQLLTAASEGRLVLPAMDGAFLLLDNNISIQTNIVGVRQKQQEQEEEQEKQKYVLMPVIAPATVATTNTNNKLDSENNTNQNTNNELPSCDNSNNNNNQPFTDNNNTVEPKYSIFNESGNDRQRVNDEILYEFLCCAKCMMNEQYVKCDGRLPFHSKNLKILQRYLKVKTGSVDPIYNVANKFMKQRQRKLGKHLNYGKKLPIHNKLTQLQRLPLAGGSVGSNDTYSSGSTLKPCDQLPPYAVVQKKQKNKDTTTTADVNKHDDDHADCDRKVDDEEDDEQQDRMPKSRKTSFDSTCTISSLDSGFIEMQQQQQQQQQIELCLTQSKNRRKSYEEFKAIFSPRDLEPKLESIKENKETSTILRKNSNLLSDILDQNVDKEGEKAKIRRKSYEEFKRLVQECDESSPPSPFKRQNSKLRRTSVTRKKSTTEEEPDKDKSKSEMYKRNFKIYDKLIYGTIYDIIQRKNDIYSLTYQKYDKYMTYGTIYEILHRKISTSSSPTDSFQRKSYSLSEKNGLIYDIIQRHKFNTHLEKSDSYSSLDVAKKCSTLYDIVNSTQRHNRFIVSKIDESGYTVPKESKKTPKLRRLSNILSYINHNNNNSNNNSNNSSPSAVSADEKSSPVSSSPSLSLQAPPTIHESDTKDEELYAKIKREKNQIVKSNSLDAITKPLPSPPIEKQRRKTAIDPPVIHRISPKIKKKTSLDDGLPLVHRRKDMLAVDTTANKQAAAVKQHSSQQSATKKGKSRRLSEFTRGEFLNEKA